jgi:hypothetical protein
VSREQAIAAVGRYEIYVPPDVVPGPGAKSRKLSEGQWDELPFGLSYHSGGDMAAYFNTNAGGQNNGDYTPIGIAPPGGIVGRFTKGGSNRMASSNCMHAGRLPMHAHSIQMTAYTQMTYTTLEQENKARARFRTPSRFSKGQSTQ